MPNLAGRPVKEVNLNDYHELYEDKIVNGLSWNEMVSKYKYRHGSRNILMKKLNQYKEALASGKEVVYQPQTKIDKLNLLFVKCFTRMLRPVEAKIEAEKILNS